MSIRTEQSAIAEHSLLRDHVEHFLVDAHAMPALDLGARIDVVERTAAFLAEMLLPHAAVAEHVLCPGAAELLGCVDEADTVHADRSAVRDLLGQLAMADPGDAGAIQEVLYALYALINALLWREEEIFVRLAAVPDQRPVHDMMERMAEMSPPRGRFSSRPAQRPIAAG